jgi:hypothetical protein
MILHVIKKQEKIMKQIFEIFLKYRYMGKMIGAEAGAVIFDKLEPVPHEKGRLRNTASKYCKY